MRPRTIVLTTFNTDNYVVRTLKLGVDAFLLKDVDPARLVKTIQQVTAGEDVLTSDVTRTLITVVIDAPAMGDLSARTLVTALTRREREVAVLMTQELTNNQIGTRLHLSLISVKSHLTSLFVKLGVDGRVSAVMIIRDVGLWNQRNPCDAPLSEGAVRPTCHAMCCSTTAEQGDPVLQEL